KRQPRPAVEGQHAMGGFQPSEARHGPASYMRGHTGKHMVDGPGPVRFDAAAILFSPVNATGRTAFVGTDDGRRGATINDGQIVRGASACCHPSPTSLATRASHGVSSLLLREERWCL